MKSEPLVSIVMPLYNSERYVEDSINSVFSQTVTDWELILVDDASTDSTYKKVEPFLTDDRIIYCCLATNSGSAVARNTAIEKAKGRYIAFLDSDDMWVPSKIETQLGFMNENKYPFSFSAYNKVDEHGKITGNVGIPRQVDYYDLLKMCSIGCLTAIYDTEYFGKVYMPLIRKRQDLGLWLKLLKQTDYAYGLNKVLANYRVHSNSISANKLNAASYTWRLYRHYEKLSLPSSVYFFSHYAIRGLIRTKTPSLARFLGILK